MIYILFFTYIFLGFIAGISSGLLGIGGGLIMVPVLNVIFGYLYPNSPHNMHVAISTSLAVVIFSTLMSAISYYRRGATDFKLIRLFSPGMVLGAIIGVLLANEMSSTILSRVFGAFTGAFGVYFILKPSPKFQISITFPPFVYAIIAIGIGMLAGLLGIGGGIILIPLLLLAGMPMLQVTATSTACSFPTALAGTLVAMIIGAPMSGLPPYYIGYVNIYVAVVVGIASLFGAPLGVKLAHQLPVKIVKRLFACLLLIVAWQMIVDPG